MRLTYLIAGLGFLLMPAISTAQIPISQFDMGNFIVRLGGSYVRPDESSTPLKFNVLQNWDLYNTRWEVDSDVTWNMSGVWKPLEHWGLELMYIGSAGFDADLTNFYGIPGRDRIGLGDFEATSSNAFINWYPLTEDCLVQPYFGIGLNYTHFHDESVSGGMEQFLIDEGFAVGGARMSIGHSWGFTAQIGVDFKFGRENTWLVNAAALYIESDSNASITFPTDIGYNRLYSDFDYNPWVFNLGVGYKFSL